MLKDLELREKILFSFICLLGILFVLVLASAVYDLMCSIHTLGY